MVFIPVKSKTIVLPPLRLIMCLEKGITKSTMSRIPKPRKRREELPRESLACVTLSVSTLLADSFNGVQISMSPPFTMIEEIDYNKQFIQKCKECSKICDFSIAIKDVTPKGNKTILLKHIAEAFTIPQFNRTILQTSLQKFFKMVAKNLFRPLQTVKIVSMIETNDQVLDDSYPHLSLVYDCLSSFYDSLLPCQLDKSFVRCLISNTCSLDSRERAKCLSVCRKACSRFANQRETLLGIVTGVLCDSICSNELISLASTISYGEANFYVNSILPLHAKPDYCRFSRELTNTCKTVVRGSPDMVNVTIKYCCKHWPERDSRKQEQLLSFFEELLEVSSTSLNDSTCSLLFKRLGTIFSGTSYSLINICVDFVLCEYMMDLLESQKDPAFNYLFPAIYSAATSNWSEDIKDDCVTLLELFSEIDEELFLKSTELIKQQKKKRSAERALWKVNWAKVFESAKLNNPSITGIIM